MTLKELKKLAQQHFCNKEIDVDDFYDWINTNTYLSVADLVNCIRPISWEMKVDKGYLYWEDTYDYLTAVLATYMDEYIRKNLDRWHSRLLDG